ncbi:MAG TPA: cohesin domain-containing protein [bacterium]|nr:cohesin domain-containing protein [bacterium]HPN42644.1 cohesin domain-containing protein [bacterium]
MKRSSTIPALILAIFVFVLCFGVPAFSQGYKLEVSKGTVAPTDGLFALPGDDGLIYIRLLNPATVKGVSFQLSAAPDSLTANGVTVLGAAAANFTAYYNQVGGVIKVLLLPNDNAQVLAIDNTEPGTDILSIAVTVRAGTPGGSTAALTLSNVSLANTSNNPITPVTAVNNTFWFGTKLDVVYNGVVDLFDVLRIIDIALDRPPVPTAYERWAADSDDDGLITIVDISAAMDESVNPGVAAAVTPLAKAAQGSVKIDMPSIPANFTGKINIPVQVNTSAPLHGLQMVIDAAGKDFMIDAPVLTDAAKSMTLVSKRADGKLSILLCGIEGQAIPAGQSTLFNLPVTVQKQQVQEGVLEIVKALAGTSGATPMQTIYGQYSAATVVPEHFSLFQNSPNPFNMNTMITFDVPNLQNGTVPVKLEIFNTTGQLVKRLVDHNKQAGRYTVQWNGSDEFGSLVSSGVYFYRLTAQDVVLTKKLAIMK